MKVPPSLKNRVKCGVWVREMRWGGEDHFLSLRLAYKNFLGPKNIMGPKKLWVKIFES